MKQSSPYCSVRGAPNACRTAVRLGAEAVYNVYRRTKDEMPADRLEIEEAEEEGVVFKRGDEYMWKCRNCGYVHTGSTAPKVCPACAHPQAFFEELADNF